MPIPLGILAAAGFRPAGAAGAYELIETVTVGSGGAASVSFTGLSAYSTTYQHLQIRAVVRTDRNSGEDQGTLTFNGSSSGYAGHFLYGYGSGSPSAEYDSTSTRIRFPNPSGATAASGIFAPVVIDILDPYETKNKTIRCLGGNQASVWFTSGLWANTSAVSSITLDQGLGSNFVQFSRFSLYGLKASA